MLEIGKLYLWRYSEAFTGRAYRDKTILVFVVNSEKVKPIYTKIKLLLMETNEMLPLVLDKFHFEKFIKNFTEVTDEEQVEQARRKAEQK